MELGFRRLLQLCSAYKQINGSRNNPPQLGSDGVSMHNVLRRLTAYRQRSLLASASCCPCASGSSHAGLRARGRSEGGRDLRSTWLPSFWGWGIEVANAQVDQPHASLMSHSGITHVTPASVASSSFFRHHCPLRPRRPNPHRWRLGRTLLPQRLPLLPQLLVQPFPFLH